MCLTVLGCSTVVLTMHGEHSTEDGEGAFVGGLNGPLGNAVGGALLRSGPDVRKHHKPNLQGREPENLSNRGTSLAGVQLELSKTVRATLFESLTRPGRQKPTARCDLFVAAVRTVLGGSIPNY